jgi:hypothetical protein
VDSAAKGKQCTVRVSSDGSTCRVLPQKPRFFLIRIRMNLYSIEFLDQDPGNKILLQFSLFRF